VKAVLTPSEAVALDTETQARGVGADTLMERAGFELARVASTMAAGQ
jgi:NAD(P)H-hydrate repair Nnr-like enzyme with NAD(P)H-hydrate epimerase domain